MVSRLLPFAYELRGVLMSVMCSLMTLRVSFMTGDCMFIELYEGFGGFRSLTKDVRIVGVAAFAGEVGASGLLILGLLALAGRCCWVGAEDWRCCIEDVASELVDGRERFSVARRAPLMAAFDRVPFGAGVV